MDAQETLGRARDLEAEAGNRGVAMALNDTVVGLFALALDTTVDDTANALYDQRYPGTVS
jgi:hypothetical protein